jgi:segregation and condensation protein A
LVYQLLEHQKFKNAAQMLYTREEVENAVWNKPPKEIIDEAEGIVAVSTFDLIKAFHEVVRRFEDRKRLEMSQEEITVEEKLADIRQLLLLRDRIRFSAFFETCTSKQHLIVTFLAILELVRLNEVRLYQKRAFSEIHIAKRKSHGKRA